MGYQAHRRKAFQQKDPYWDNVIFLHNFQGPNGSTTVTDQSKYGHTLSWGGTARIASETSIPGVTSSLNLQGGNNYVSVTNNSLFNLGTGDFTFETWVYLTSYLSSNNGYFSGQLWNKDSGSSRDYIWCLTGTANSYTGFTFVKLLATAVTINTTLALNTPYYLSVARLSGVAYAHVNGVLINTGGTTFTDFLSGSSSPQIGRTDYGSPYFYNIPGNLAMFRVTSAARYGNSNYPVPTAPFPIG